MYGNRRISHLAQTAKQTETTEELIETPSNLAGDFYWLELNKITKALRFLLDWHENALEPRIKTQIKILEEAILQLAVDKVN